MHRPFFCTNDTVLSVNCQIMHTVCKLFHTQMQVSSVQLLLSEYSAAAQSIHQSDVEMSAAENRCSTVTV